MPPKAKNSAQPVHRCTQTKQIQRVVLDDPEHKEVLSDIGECKFADIDILQEVDTKIPVGDPLREKQILSVKTISPVMIYVEKSIAEKPIYEVVQQGIGRIPIVQAEGQG